ncbi:MAG: hypothetical protein JW810_11825 [Sedimentisphaerales bacterium]|nr:hypothetical protein [Sedimentisphaerales bacterium]
MKRYTPVLVPWLFLLSTFFLAVPAPIPIQAQDTDPRLENPPDPWRSLGSVERTIPLPLPDHPGNIFLEDEPVTVRIPRDLPATTVRWRVLDDAQKVIARKVWSPQDKDSPLPLGQPGIGWYRIEFLDAENQTTAWTTAAVLARLQEPTPQDSPVCVDSATAWFARDNPDKQLCLARLGALAGVNWVRDRMHWGGIQPQTDTFVERTTYDLAATIQHQNGLKVLQVFHDTPSWAADKTLDPEKPTGRFPRDLRDVYRFAEAMGRRFPGRVLAWEPWNEANIQMFGGHTINEMCSFQKAAYLGFKAGDPELIVGWNAYTGVPTQRHTEGLLANEAWPYYDTYNIHSYDWPDSYDALWEPARRAACGRPIWITEADRGMPFQSPAPWCDLTQKGEHQKAQLLAQEYVYSLFAGAQRHFHFILGHYFENFNGVQFGLLRLDHTPRPAYVALAAVGRLLAGARPLGRWSIPDQPDAHVYALGARPDGRPSDILVAWAEKRGDWPQRGQVSVAWSLPPDIEIRNVYDYLGRSRGRQPPDRLTSSVVFILLPPGQAQKLALEPPPAVSPYRTGAPSPVVLQVQLPGASRVRFEEKQWSEGYVYGLKPDEPTELTFYAYNFGPSPVKGTVAVESIPDGWQMTPRLWPIAVESMQRQKFSGRFLLSSAAAEADAGNWIRLRGDFDQGGRPVLAFYLKTGKPQDQKGP